MISVAKLVNPGKAPATNYVQYKKGNLKKKFYITLITLPLPFWNTLQPIVIKTYCFIVLLPNIVTHTLPYPWLPHFFHILPPYFEFPIQFYSNVFHSFPSHFPCIILSIYYYSKSSSFFSCVCNVRWSPKVPTAKKYRRVIQLSWNFLFSRTFVIPSLQEGLALIPDTSISGTNKTEQSKSCFWCTKVKYRFWRLWHHSSTHIPAVFL